MEVMLIIENRVEQHTPGVGDKSVSLAAKPRILFSPAAAGGCWLLLPPHGDIKSALPVVPGGPGTQWHSITPWGARPGEISNHC